SSSVSATTQISTLSYTTLFRSVLPEAAQGLPDLALAQGLQIAPAPDQEVRAVGEQLGAPHEPAPGPADPPGDGPHLPLGPGEQGDDPIRLAEGLAPEDNPFRVVDHRSSPPLANLDPVTNPYAIPIAPKAVPPVTAGR